MEPFKILLIAYKNRSGSTLLSNWLSKDERIIVMPEGGDIPVKLLADPLKIIDEKNFNLIKENLINNIKLSTWNVDFLANELLYSEELTAWQLIKTILELYRAKTKRQAEVFVLKHPSFADLFNQVSKFPVYRGIVFILFLVRDGRAIYNSSKKSLQSNLPVPMEYNPIQSAKSWIVFIKKLPDSKKNDTDNNSQMVVKYEDIVMDMKSTLKKIYLFIKLNFDLNKLKEADLSGKITDKQKHLHVNIDNKPMTVRIDSWSKELNPWEIYLFEKKAKNYLLLYNYQLSQGKSNMNKSIFSYMNLAYQNAFNFIRFLYYKLK